MAIREEQAAFEAMLDTLVGDPATAGKHVLIFGGKVEGTFDSRGDAYAAGLKRFGTTAEFLIAQAVKKEPPVNISVAWELGLVRVEQT
jgi:hypothetical protein